MPSDPDHRSGPEDGGRTLDPTVICRIARAPVSPRRSDSSSTPQGAISAYVTLRRRSHHGIGPQTPRRATRGSEVEGASPCGTAAAHPASGTPCTWTSAPSIAMAAGASMRRFLGQQRSEPLRPTRIWLLRTATHLDLPSDIAAPQRHAERPFPSRPPLEEVHERRGPCPCRAPCDSAPYPSCPVSSCSPACSRRAPVGACPEHTRHLPRVGPRAACELFEYDRVLPARILDGRDYRLRPYCD